MYENDLLDVARECGMEDTDFGYDDSGLGFVSQGRTTAVGPSNPRIANEGYGGQYFDDIDDIDGCKFASLCPIVMLILYCFDLYTAMSGYTANAYGHEMIPAGIGGHSVVDEIENYQSSESMADLYSSPSPRQSRSLPQSAALSQPRGSLQQPDALPRTVQQQRKMQSGSIMCNFNDLLT